MEFSLVLVRVRSVTVNGHLIRENGPGPVHPTGGGRYPYVHSLHLRQRGVGKYSSVNGDWKNGNCELLRSTWYV
jgi:hypothetical protein